ncbi:MULTISPECIES: hypothetical protein [Commensalibacter]|uniref:hypothetical protein n=1 Tax=Commensalibacter TaxID=1079922 RepID=UPI0004EA7B63|nr:MULTISPECIES: hypothetical protein [Commensalibacter]MCT6843074.1 hypothetical protein [Commensalibacter sp.]MBH9973894.1 hypothetical protein [Commensalibacter melissae]MBI0017443.1 hypothetical protein [Commensalibacter sp. B14384M2]MBI0019190.1 hypothetical protein [Commensalibacter sp. W8133]MBI0050491.1 hypothetical protein [Commensalibacter sp. B14384M3]
MKILQTNELSKVAGGHGHNNNHQHHNNNQQHNNHHDRVINPPHNGKADGLAKLNIIKTGLENGDNWATIGKNIHNYFAEKYSFVDHFGR